MKSYPYTLFIYVVILFEHPGPDFVRSLVGLTASVETAPYCFPKTNTHAPSRWKERSDWREILWIWDP